MVTGLRVRAPCGNDTSTVFCKRAAVRSGVGRHSKAFPDDATSWLTGEVPALSTETFTKMRLGTLDRTTLLALLAVLQVLA